MPQRLLILADGQLDPFRAKTTACLLRYRPGDVVGVLDREHAGRTAAEVLGVPSRAPVVGTIAEGLALGPNTLVIGIAPQGGALPTEWRPLLAASLQAGLSILAGLHVFLGEDPELAALAARYGGKITDLRRPPEGQPIAAQRALSTRARRVLTVGTDCNVGKMVTSFELVAAGLRQQRDVRIVPTGQTGMMIAGHGIGLDRVPGDFMAGWVESLVLREADAEAIVIEGQGSLLHPAYSPVTLALLHGGLPDAMVLVHHAGRAALRFQGVVIPPLTEWIRRYEDAVAPLHPGRVTGIAINPTGLGEREARAAVLRAEDETGLPAADVVSAGAECLLEAALAGS